MNPGQQQSGQNPAQYMQQYAGYMPTGQAGFYPAAYPAYPTYGGYPASTMDAQYMGYYGMTAALPTATTVTTPQVGSATNSQVKYFVEISVGHFSIGLFHLRGSEWG
jgi:hypothetical protein